MNALDLLVTDMIPEYDADWESISDITSKDIINLESNEFGSSWIYAQNEVVWLPRMDMNLVMDWLCIHKLLVSARRYIKDPLVSVFGDQYGIISSAFRINTLNFYREQFEELSWIRNKNKVYASGDFKSATYFVNLTDDIMTSIDVMSNSNIIGSASIINSKSQVDLCGYLFVATNMNSKPIEIKKMISCNDYTIVLMGDE